MCDLIWDQTRFPDPPALLKQLHELGYHVCLWMNSYLDAGSERYREAAAKGYLLKDAQGNAYAGNVWDASKHPTTGIVDFTNPEAVEWMKGLLRPLLRMGADVMKTDFGESVWPDAVAHNGMTGEQLHNLYPLLYNDCVAEVTPRGQRRQRAGVGPLHLCRRPAPCRPVGGRPAVHLAARWQPRCAAA